MTDKRSTHPGMCPIPKRAKTFPLESSDRAIVRDDSERTTRHRSSTFESQRGSQTPEHDSAGPPESPRQASPIPSPRDDDDLVDGRNLVPATNSESKVATESPEVRKELSMITDYAKEDEDEYRGQSSPRLTDGSSGRLIPTDNKEPDYEDDIDEFAPQTPSSEINLCEELGPWSPPPEPLRPPNPYVRGRDLKIWAHKASPPFGDDYPDYPGVRNYISERELRTKTLVELCLEHPPMDGETAWEMPPRSLYIVDEIRVRDDGGAQLVICRLDDEDHEYAAKIYDPLYYGFSDRIWPENPRDVADEADKDYCREVAAYLEINDRFGGKTIPKYYGSWTFQMPLDLPHAREVRDVRLILMEHIKGDTMSEMEPLVYPEEFRLGAMAQVLEAYSRITFAGVSHGDIAQRNVMVCRGGADNVIHKIVLIDFNYAVVTRLDNFELLYGSRPKGSEKPENPINQWWGTGGLYSKFGDWFPASWNKQRRPLRQWLFERWAKSQEFLPPNEPLDWKDE